MSESIELNADDRTGSELAVIGMAGRFPGARDIHEFWNNLKNGVESVSFYSDNELDALGISSELPDNPNFVKSQGGALQDKELFDASFFGYTPREAEIMDPQIRIFHECAWEALEDAGYDARSYHGLIGLYAGASSNFYWQGIALLTGESSELGFMASSQLSDKDYLSTRIAYKLNLKGPVFTVQTACSTSLVAIHLACQGILNGECDIALAGGVSVSSGKAKGYLYQEGMINSPDGHCRAFDENARGTIGGEGVGIVVLKSLEDALRDRDHIFAVIKGTAVNNDGVRKVGYTAPSIEGQAQVIGLCQHLAEVDPTSISYVEAHGTGTVLGDPVEIEGLKMAFNTDKKGFCAIGSVKTNVGHLNAAAGVAGLIKTVLALKYKLIPPSLHFETPNPKIDFENSPFYVNTKLTEWKTDRYPLRAGVSSFGIGGTNAHVVLEEARTTTHNTEGTRGLAPLSNAKISREYQLILLSANSELALDKMSENLAAHFKKNPHINLADAAHTLQVGRSAFKYRKMLTVSHVDEAIERLSSPRAETVENSEVKVDEPYVIFMFPGQGSQYVNMGKDLYKKEPVFREEMDRCFEILNTLVDYDIKEIFYPSPVTRHPSPSINQTEITQPFLFAFEYALARLLMEWGIKPFAMIGHSIGEYVAACLSGVLSLEEALKLLLLRGRMMQQMPAGTMLAVSLSEKKLKSLLKLNDKISLAAVNSPSHCVVSGPDETIADFSGKLKEKGYKSRYMYTSHAFHSAMMNPILEKFAEEVNKITLKEPIIPYISNVTGNWITIEEATDPRYWAKHLRRTVRFADGINELLKEKNSIFMEVGPGRTLSTFAKKIREKNSHHPVMNLVRHPREDVCDSFYLLDKIGRLWLYGITPDWAAFYAREKRQRVPLPTYPFQRLRYWDFKNPLQITAEIYEKVVSERKKSDMADWFYTPLWEQSPRNIKSRKTVDTTSRCNWLVFIDKNGFAHKMVKQLQLALQQEAGNMIAVREGLGFAKISEGEYTIHPQQESDYDQLFAKLQILEKIPGKILHFWGVIGDYPGEPDIERLDWTQDRGIYSLLGIVRAIGRAGITNQIEMSVVTDNMQNVTGEEELCPTKAAVLGAVKVIPLEYPNIKCSSIDITLPLPGSQQENNLIKNLVEEFTTSSSDKVLAYRGLHRWVQIYKPFRLEESKNPVRRCRDRGVYLITGGFGGMGFTLAEHLAKSYNARLILLGRSAFPQRKDWQKWLESHHEEDTTNRKIRKIQELEKQGAEIIVASADISNHKRVREIIHRAKERFGTLNGVIHTAGIADYQGVIQRRTREMTERILASKVKGTLVLDKVLKDERLDFMALFSSIGNILFGVKFGQVGYNAANEFLDAFALYKNSKHGPFTVSINWNDWLEVGMSVKAIQKRHKREGNSDTINYKSEFPDGISPAQGVEVFNRILENSLPRVAISIFNLNTLMERINAPKPQNEDLIQTGPRKGKAAPDALYKRPEISSEYAAPRNKVEQKLVEIWQRFFGIEPIGIYDDFFDLGGDSLQVTGVVAIIHKELHVKVAIPAFFAAPTIKCLTEFINSAQKVIFSSIKSVEKKEFYASSPAQQGLYFLQQLDTANVHYNQPFVVILEGELNIKKLQQAFIQLIKRHESLRMSFKLIEGELVQFIHDEENVAFKMEYHDSTNSIVNRQSELSVDQIIADFVRPFDMSKPPLFRTNVIKINQTKHIVIVDIHHIISDGLSNDIFKRELGILYDGQILPPLRIQYKEYSEWMFSEENRNALKRQERYWFNEFNGEIPVLNIPTDFPGTKVIAFEGSNEKFSLAKEYAEKLVATGRNNDATLFMVLLAIYNILLSKLSGQQDIIVGTTTVGRRHTELKCIVGMFVNMLALRNFPTGNLTFLDFLKNLRIRTLQAFENQDYQFDQLVAHRAGERDGYRNPIVRVVFSFNSLVHSTKKLQIDQKKETVTLERKNYEYQHKISKFDLMLECLESSDGLFFLFEYNTKLFKKETAKKFIAFFREIVFSVLNSPEKKIKDIELISDNEKQSLIKRLRSEKDKFFKQNPVQVNQTKAEHLAADFDY